MTRRYSIFVISAALSLAGFGCAPIPSRTSLPSVTPPAAVLGAEVALTVGASATYADGLVASLKAINDSRCPEGVQCIWQGELSPVLSLKGGALAGDTELTFGTVRGLTGTADGYALTLSDVTETSVVLVVTKSDAQAGSRADKILLASPAANDVVGSPLTVMGEARGTWYFETSFPVKLLDAFGNVLAVVPAQAQSEWMTEDLVSFKAELSFAAPTTATGTLVLVKDNPSGMPQFADELRVPVRFAVAPGPVRRIKLFFYDPAKDSDGTGNVLCSRQGLVPVERDISVTKTPIQDAVRLLLQGGLTDEERAAGVTTEYPLPGVELKGAALRDGALSLEFADPDNRTGGGSCRVGILWFQIEATAKQFSEVSSVRFIPEELFQP